MRIPFKRRPHFGLHLYAALLATLLSSSVSIASADPSPPAVTAADPWKAPQIIKPAQLAAVLADSTHAKPLLLHVGFKKLFAAGAIPGSRYAGPGSRADGIAALKQAVKGVPRERGIVLYCGCCPWDHCPNMRPAFKTLRDLGYKNVRALYITKNLDTDWVNKGYPIETTKR